MSTATKPRKPVKPVSGSCRWAIPPVAVRDFETGVLEINGTEYAVTITREQGQAKGARLTKPDQTQYHVDLVTGNCDCPDRHYRGRECKHLKAVSAALRALTEAA